MNTKIKIGVSLLGMVLISSLRAQITSYEGFNYTVAQTLEAQADWAPANTGTAPTIVSGSLSVAGLQSSTGNSVSLPGGNYQEVLGSLSTYNSGSVYYSFALNLTSAPTGAAYSFALSTGGTNYGAVVWLQASGAGYNLGLSNRSSGVTPTYDTTVLALNTTVFVVGRYTFNAGVTNDTSALWINPSSGTFEDVSAPTPTLTSATGTDLTAVTQFLIRGAAGSPAGVFDELRVGTTWASVTTSAIPEPSTASVLAGGLVLAGVVMQRRRRALV